MSAPDSPRFIQATSLAAVPGLRHGFGQRGPEGSAPPPPGTLLMKQVHGADVCRAPWEGTPEGDASLASGVGVLLGIKTADCLPVLIADPRRRAVAAAHAGWRGTVAGVTRAAVQALVRDGSRASDLVAGLGPGIGPCCYEVGDDVRAAFGEAGARYFTPTPSGRDHLDVRAANKDQLLAAGVPESSLSSVDHCTYCRADLYHSYRRDGPRSGRMISFVGFAPSS